MQLFRLLKIIFVSLRYGLDDILTSHHRIRIFRIRLSSLVFWRSLQRPRGERLRLALEALGPIFVKFGQVLSTRRDLLPADIVDELVLLQDRVLEIQLAISTAAPVMVASVVIQIILPPQVEAM